VTTQAPSRGRAVEPRPPAAKRMRTVSFAPAFAVERDVEVRSPQGPAAAIAPVVFVRPARVRGVRYAPQCAKCGRAVEQDEPAALCDQRPCDYLLCSRCFPDVSVDLLCPRHAACIAVLTSKGRVVLPLPDVIVPTVPSKTALGASLSTVMATLLGSMPASVSSGMNRVVRCFHDFLPLIGSSWSTLSASDVCMYFLARCSPQDDAGLPSTFPKPVLPVTARGDLSLLRRYARTIGDTVALAALKDDLVSRLVAATGANVQRDKSPKRPVLVADLEKFIRRAPARGRDRAKRRDEVLLLVGLLFGLRRSELIRLTLADVKWDGSSLRLRIVTDKTNQSILGVHHARFVSSGHALLDELWPLYMEDFLSLSKPEDVLFCRLDRDGKQTTCPLALSSVSTAVKSAVGPGFSAHSLRVGCATELFRAGVPVAVIKEIGRWRSDAALLYIIPDAERMVEAGRSIGIPKVHRSLE
jgi:integrase